MAAASIVDKLKNELRAELTTERQVVYILVEIRKMLESEGLERELFALNFHCCWALHTRMDRSGAFHILERFGEAYPIAMQAQRFEMVPESIGVGIAETMAAVKFKSDMAVFLKKYNLPTRIIDDDFEWWKFLSLYTEVIEDCSLVLRDEGVQVPYVDIITVRKIRDWPALETREGEVILFATEWTATNSITQRSGTWALYFTVPKHDLGQKASSVLRHRGTNT